MNLHKLMTKNNKSDLYWDLAELASGIGLAFFFVSHMFNDSTIILGAKAFNTISHLMEEFYFHQIGIPVVFLLIVFHMVVAGRRIPNRVSNLKIILRHSKLINHADTWMWIFQVVSGVGIGFLAAAHIWTMASHGEITAQISAARVQLPINFIFYIVLMILGACHTGLGVYREIIKWIGIDRKKVKSNLAMITAGIILLSVISLFRFLTI